MPDHSAADPTMKSTVRYTSHNLKILVFDIETIQINHFRVATAMSLAGLGTVVPWAGGGWMKVARHTLGRARM
jgi:hypothetical protein